VKKNIIKKNKIYDKIGNFFSIAFFHFKFFRISCREKLHYQHSAKQKKKTMVTSNDRMKMDVSVIEKMIYHL